MQGFYLTINWPAANHAGSKAQDDVCTILKRKGLDSIFIDGEQSKWEKRLFMRSELRRKLSSLDKDSLLLVQYPFYMGRYSDYEIIKQTSKHFKNSTLLIHDIPSLRNGLDDKAIFHEIKMFNKFSFLIVHNDSMRKWLINHGCTSEMYTLNVFDYIVPEDYVSTIKSGSYKRVFFAGNLGKSDFIYSKNVSKRFEMYGINLKDRPFNFTYRGQLTPDDLVKTLSKQQGFGLVWDGSEVERSNEYTKYNSPHKTSLYLCSGMPVIVWKESALASFIEEKKVGFSVSSIKDIEVALDSITLEQYNSLQENAKSLGKKLRQGANLGKSVDEIFQIEK